MNLIIKLKNIMRKLFLSSAALLIINICIHSSPGWIIQNTEIPSNTDLTKIQFIDANTGYITGVYGYVYKTTNGGINWFSTNANNITANFFWSGYFINVNTGWAIGANGTIIKTTNGGTNWTTQNSGSSTVLHYIYFINDQTGWITGWNGVIRKTTNQGTTWEVQNAGTTMNLFNVFLMMKIQAG